MVPLFYATRDRCAVAFVAVLPRLHCGPPRPRPRPRPRPPRAGPGPPAPGTAAPPLPRWPPWESCSTATRLLLPRGVSSSSSSQAGMDCTTFRPGVPLQSWVSRVRDHTHTSRDSLAGPSFPPSWQAKVGRDRIDLVGIGGRPEQDRSFRALDLRATSGGSLGSPCSSPALETGFKPNQKKAQSLVDGATHLPGTLVLSPCRSLA